MTRFTAFMFAAAIAIWGLASIPDGSDNDKGSMSHQRSQLARTRGVAFVAPAQRSGMSALPPLALVALRPKGPSVPE
jgi:hypothetical protein